MDSASSESLVGKEIFSTGEAAELCKVSQQTIIRCFDAGRLGGFRVPGSKFRRIPRQDLLNFMKANSLDCSPLRESVAILALRLAYVEPLGFPKSEKYSVAMAGDAEEFLMRLLSFRVALIYGDGERDGPWVQTVSSILSKLTTGRSKPRVAFICPDGIPLGLEITAIDVRLPAPTFEAQLRDLQIFN